LAVQTVKQTSTSVEVASIGTGLDFLAGASWTTAQLCKPFLDIGSTRVFHKKVPQLSATVHARVQRRHAVSANSALNDDSLSLEIVQNTLHGHEWNLKEAGKLAWIGFLEERQGEEHVSPLNAAEKLSL
jgi:hypothetical protein